MNVRAPSRIRLDTWLVERGLAASRERAQALVLAGRVRINGLPATKAGAAVPAAACVEVAPGPEHVSRGALKLAGALDAFALDVEGRLAVDIGASTGGFTEVLLRRGVRRVYAIDVGRAQLHERLRRNPRVVSLESTNARHLGPAVVPEACGIAAVDVSFISVRKLLPALRSVLAEGADVLVLVKPQFEVGRRDVGRGGLVKDPALHASAVRAVAAAACEAGFAVRGVCASPIEGGEGNREFFLHLVRDGESIAADTFDAMMAAAISR